MADHPMPFSAPMVRALLAGTKTQTRRILKPSSVSEAWPGTMWPLFVNGKRTGSSSADPEVNRLPDDLGGLVSAPIPTLVGDRLWVREAWRSHAQYDDLAPSQMSGDEPVRYGADGNQQTWGYPAISKIGRYRPSMLMPRWASRLTLTVTDVRVQRLKEISEDDARAEGAYIARRSGRVADNYESMAIAGIWFATARHWYADLWDRINGPGSWDANPWVAAYTFTVHRCNIDQMEAAE